MTTQLLEEAFAEAAKLPERDQDALATWVMEELASEKKWETIFANSQGLLARLGEQALTEHNAGKTRRLDVNEL